MLAAKGGARDTETGTVDPTGANPEGQNIGQLLPLGTNPDGSHFFTGNRNVDATLIGSKWGTTDLTFSFPTSGSNYNGSVPLNAGVANYHIDLGTQQQLAARASKPWPGGKEPGEGHDSARSPSRRRVQAPGVPPPEWGPR